MLYRALSTALCISTLGRLSAAQAQNPGRDVAAPQQDHTQYVGAIVNDSLERSLACIEPRYGRALAAEVARLLRWRGDIQRLVRRGDRVALLFKIGAPRRGQPPLPELVALQYAGTLLKLSAYRFVDLDGQPRYFDGDGVRVEPLMLHAPVPDYTQISEVVQRGRGKRRHRGDDLMAAEGSVVVLPFPGTVTRLNWHRRHNGHCVEVALDAGYIAHFLHLAQLAPELAVGDRLAAGSVLGQVGNTGHSSGPHLHYELLRRREPIEPLRVHGVRRAVLGADQMDSFGRRRLALMAQLRAGAAQMGP